MIVAFIKFKDPDLYTVNDILVDRLSAKYRVVEYDNLFSAASATPDVYCSRFSSGRSGTGLWSIAAFLEQQGAAPVNSLSSFIVSSNKHLTQLAFQKNDIPQPPWALGHPGGQVEFFGERWSGKTVLKPNVGGGGRNISVLESLERAESALQGRGETMILQPYIENRALWRIIFSEQQGLVSAYQKKTEQEIASISKGASRFYADASPALEELARKMTAAIGVGISGLDVLETESGFLALESNANFDFSEKEEGVFAALEKEIELAAEKRNL